MANVELINIDTQNDLDYIFSRIDNGPTFSELFMFKTDELRNKLFSYLNVSINDFSKKNYYFDTTRKLHISESNEGYYWISTMGLVPPKEKTNNYKNKYVRACRAQFVVIELILEKAKNVCMDESVYDVDGYYFNYLNELNTALFHNIVFYFEVFGKAYLSLNEVAFPKSHKLNQILPLVKETMFNLNQNDTVFHVSVVAEFERFAKYIGTISDDFREEFIKYEDNQNDYTVIVFGQEELSDLHNTVALCDEIITDYYFKIINHENLSEVLHLQPGLHERLLNMSQTEEDRQRITRIYSFLLKRD